MHVRVNCKILWMNLDVSIELSRSSDSVILTASNRRWLNVMCVETFTSISVYLLTDMKINFAWSNIS
jgi:hypothetical protein